MRSVATRDEAGHSLLENLVRHRLTDIVAGDEREPRARLVASRMPGLGVVRRVARSDPIATAEVDRRVDAVAPTDRRRLTGPLD